MQTLDRSQRTLGILWVIYGAICIAQAAWMFVEAPVLTLMWGAIITRVPNPFAWMDIFHIVLIAAIALGILSAIFSFLAGMSLMGAPRPNRTIVLVAAFLGLIRGPLGIAIGVYTLTLFVRRTATEDYRMPAAA
jgi:hypothetical protein